MTTPAQSFLAAVAPYRQYPELMAGIASAAGCGDVDRLAATLVTSWIEPGESVFTAWVLLEGGFVIHERSTDGRTFSLAVPLTRIRRIAEEGAPDGAVRLTIEIDADRNVVELNGESAEDGSFRLLGSALHAGYSLQATAPRAEQLREFATGLRAAMLS
jgi:hypothetical protein